jgi:hypothetical protein
MVHCAGSQPPRSAPPSSHCSVKSAVVSRKELPQRLAVVSAPHTPLASSHGREQVAASPLALCSTNALILWLTASSTMSLGNPAVTVLKMPGEPNGFTSRKVVALASAASASEEITLTVLSPDRGNWITLILPASTTYTRGVAGETRATLIDVGEVSSGVVLSSDANHVLTSRVCVSITRILPFPLSATSSIRAEARSFSRNASPLGLLNRADEKEASTAPGDPAKLPATRLLCRFCRSNTTIRWRKVSLTYAFFAPCASSCRAIPPTAPTSPFLPSRVTCLVNTFTMRTASPSATTNSVASFAS